MAKSILPVIVLYQTHLSDSATYLSLIKPNGIEEFVVYDNSPANFAQEDITALCPGAIYVRDTQNSGLPKAYNLTAQRAGELGYKRILLLDDDTTFPPEAFRAYLDTIDFAGVTAPISVTSLGQPFSPYKPSVWKKTPKDIQSGTYSLRDFIVINSGLCIPTTLFLEAGGYDERIYLDFADFQFLQKVRQINDDLWLLPFVITQNYSNDDKDLGRALRRYRIYLECANACRLEGFNGHLLHHYSMMRRTLGLCCHHKSLKFMGLYVKNLFKSKHRKPKHQA